MKPLLAFLFLALLASGVFAEGPQTMEAARKELANTMVQEITKAERNVIIPDQYAFLIKPAQARLKAKNSTLVPLTIGDLRSVYPTQVELLQAVIDNVPDAQVLYFVGHTEMEHKAAEQVKASAKAEFSIQTLNMMDETAALPPDLEFLQNAAAKRYAEHGLKPPAKWTATAVIKAFVSVDDMRMFMQDHYEAQLEHMEAETE